MTPSKQPHVQNPWYRCGRCQQIAYKVFFDVAGVAPRWVTCWLTYWYFTH